MNGGEDDDNDKDEDAIRTFGIMIMKIETFFLMLIFL